MHMLQALCAALLILYAKLGEARTYQALHSGVNSDNAQQKSSSLQSREHICIKTLN